MIASRLAVAVLALALAGGCARASFEYARGGELADTKIRTSYFLGGLVGHHDIAAEELCGKRDLREVRRQMTVGNWFAHFGTFSIWAPVTVQGVCGPATAAAPADAATEAQTTPEASE